MSNLPLIIAHRGLHYQYPENSVPAIRASIEQGFGVEFDIRFLADGSAVVHHDATLERSCGEKVHIEQIASLDALSQYRLLDHDGQATQWCIPALSEVLALLDHAIAIRLEIKLDQVGLAAQSAMQRFVDQYAAQLKQLGVVIISFNPQAIRCVRQTTTLAYRYIVGSNFERALPHWKHLLLYSRVARWYALGSGPQYLSCDWRIVDHFDPKVDIECWTVDNREAVDLCLRHGAGALTSNDPVGIREMLKQA